MLPDGEDDPLPQSLSELEESIKGRISEAADRLLDMLEKDVAEAARCHPEPVLPPSRRSRGRG
jgi:hypothetical protein